MAKRSRVAGRPTTRPRPSRVPGARPAPGRPASPPATPSLTEAEAARAAELEAQLVSQEQAAARSRAAAAAARGRRPGRDFIAGVPDQPLSVRAAQEYAYVARDIRRIGLTAGLVLAILIGLAIAINVMGIIRV
jgi:hypothetical protein